LNEGETRNDELRGGCQCGAVRYAARVDSLDAYYCHCRMCQRAFGNVFAAFVQVGKEDVVWERGEPAYFHSSRIARRGFCRECGTPLSFEYTDQKRSMDLSVGSLDEPGRMRPVEHCGFEGHVESFFTDDGLPRSRTEDSEEYVALWKGAHGEHSKPGPLGYPLDDESRS
jgi:hypothetical protein